MRGFRLPACPDCGGRIVWAEAGAPSRSASWISAGTPAERRILCVVTRVVSSAPEYL